MLTRNLSILVVAILALGFAPKDEPNPEPPPDPSNLDGTWELQSQTTTTGGVMKLSYSYKVTVKGKSWDQVLIRNGKQYAAVKYSIEADTKKKPAWLDLTRAGNRIIMRGIYEVKGDTLRFCYVSATSTTIPRPSSFTDKTRSYYIMTFKKVKK